ncbi:MAG TPA: hypothetical protein VN832_09675, partial [Stellaceae bacterium]|nr:hypothetical protein [Stellaceae bacterium]
PSMAKPISKRPVGGRDTPGQDGQQYPSAREPFDRVPAKIMIKIIAETKATVTLRRKDFRALIEAAEDRLDLAAVQAHRAHERHVGWIAARRSYLTRVEAQRLICANLSRPRRGWS